jgi:hypothetical protein
MKPRDTDVEGFRCSLGSILNRHAIWSGALIHALPGYIHNYYAGDTVHITGGISTPSCTWTYTSAGGLAVAVTIYDPNGLLVLNSTTNPSAAGYKLYAYDYPLSAGAVAGRYTIDVSYGYSCGGGRILGQGTFQVVPTTACTNYLTTTVTSTSCYLAQIFGLSITVHTDKSTYLQGETVHVTGDWGISRPPPECGTMYVVEVTRQPMIIVVTDDVMRVVYRASVLDANILFVGLPASSGNFSSIFLAQYDWAAGNYTVTIYSGTYPGQASANFRVVANPSAVLTTVTTLTTYTTTVPEFTSLALILSMAVIMITLFVRRIDGARMSRRSFKGEIAV